MNEHDKQNLDFLLKAEPAVIRDWAGKMAPDDIYYAQELLLQHADELRERSREILVEAEMARVDPSYSLAGEILKRFRVQIG